MSFVTTAPAPTITPIPILTPDIIIARVPIHTSLPISVRSRATSSPCSLIGTSVRQKTCPHPPSITTSGPIITSFPISKGPLTRHRIPMPELLPIVIPFPVPKSADCSIFTFLPESSKHRDAIAVLNFLMKREIDQVLSVAGRCLAISR